jgi:cobalamin biosynthesis protein CobT
VLSDLINGMVDESLATVKDWSDVSIYPFALAIYARGYCKRVPLAKGLEPIFETAFKRIDSCKSSGDTLALAEWVYAQLKLPNQPGNEPENKPNNEPGNKPDNEPGNQSSDESSNESSGESTDESSDESTNNSSNTPGIDPGERKQVRENDYASDVEPRLDGKDNALSICESAPKAEAYHTQGGYKFSTDVQVPGRLRFEVRRMFENSAREEFQFNRKSGQLNTGSLYSIGYNDKLFKRHHETAGIESAVVICLDVSSSMFEDNNRLIRVAVPTCAVLTDTLKRAGVNVAIITYGTYPSLLKGFNAPFKQALERLSDVGRGGGTDDFSALRQAHLMLHKRAEQRKVAFVITDGIGMYKFTSDQVASGERLGITTVGVGIMHDVSNTFSKSVTVRRPQDLATACFNQIKLV